MKLAIFYHSCYCTMTAKNPAMDNNASTNIFELYINYLHVIVIILLCLPGKNVISKISLMGTRIVPNSCRCKLS